jgi:hypothetical protein
MGQSSNRSFVFLVTGNYLDDDGSNDISAVGFAGTVHAYGGNDRVLTASFYTKIEKSWGDLGVWGLNGGIDIRKSRDGSITTHALAANSYIDHWGNSGDIKFWGGRSAARFIEMARQEMSIFTGLQLQVI